MNITRYGCGRNEEENTIIPFYFTIKLPPPNVVIGQKRRK